METDILQEPSSIKETYNIIKIKFMVIGIQKQNNSKQLIVAPTSGFLNKRSFVAKGTIYDGRSQRSIACTNTSFLAMEKGEQKKILRAADDLPDSCLG